MSFDVLGFVVLFFSLLVAVVIQVGLALAAMYGMHRFLPDQLPEKNYLQFDFDNFQKQPFVEMLTRLIVIFLGPTMLLHILVFVFVGFYGVRKHYMIVGFTLFVLEVAAIAAGFIYLLKLDRIRTGILTALSALIYLLLLTLFLYRKLS